MGECKENLQNDKETNTKHASDIPALILILKKEMENTDTVDATLQQIKNTNNNKGKKGEYYIMQYKYCFLKNYQNWWSNTATITTNNNSNNNNNFIL